MVVNYAGLLHSPLDKELRGAKFDSSIGRRPFSFALGADRVIRGWDEGVAGVRIGSQRGAGGIIPSDATPVFEVELREAK